MKERLDVLLVKIYGVKEKAKRSGYVRKCFCGGTKREDKAGSTFPEEVRMSKFGGILPYVSRGGLKLKKRSQNFDVSRKR